MNEYFPVVVQVIPMDNFHVQVFFDDGKIVDYDATKDIHSELFNKCSKNSPTSSGGEMNCTSGHICSKNPYSTKETLVLHLLM